ncbi:hypothetical protein H0H93_000724 [Arthromyces matolae]|nr:hypothetical protein H0H93_000724 [Arthromyces matolae]
MSSPHPATPNPAKRPLIRRVPVNLQASPKRLRFGDENTPVLGNNMTTPPRMASLPIPSTVPRTHAPQFAFSLSQADSSLTVQQSCKNISSSLDGIKKRHDDEIAHRIATDIKLRKAEQKIEELEKEVTDLRGRVEELKGAELENEEKDSKLKVALAEIDRLREHSKAVGHYLIDSVLKKEDSDAIKEEI